jgi:hypothetical protein
MRGGTLLWLLLVETDHFFLLVLLQPRCGVDTIELRSNLAPEPILRLQLVGQFAAFH